jgi:hypothetical protein
MKKMTVIHETIFVDFKTRTVLSRQTQKIKMAVKSVPKPVTYDFTNFNEVPEDSNFACFSDQERMEYADHILEHIHDASFADLVHWANMGMIDMKKVNALLNLDKPGFKAKRKK